MMLHTELSNMLYDPTFLHNIFSKWIANNQERVIVRDKH